MVFQLYKGIDFATLANAPQPIAVSTGVSNLLNDLRYALRRLVASPGFAFAAVATMALGIGANSAIFTVVNTVMLKPAAVEQPERLVEIYTYDADGLLPVTSSYLDYRDFRDLQVFAGGAAAYELT